MANTKKLSGSERKKAKRTARRELARLRSDLTRKQRAALRKEKQGIKAFLAVQASAKSEG